MSKILITLLILAALAGHAKDGIVWERIWLDVLISGKSAKVAFDSGANFSALTPKAVQRLALKATPTSTNDVPANFGLAMTEELPVTIGGRQAHVKFVVLNLPEYVTSDFDGLIGMWDLSGCILRVNADRHEIEFLDRLPKQVSEFTRLAIATNSGTLDLEIPSSLATNRILYVDTGSPDGVALPATEWQEWKRSHPLRPRTLGTAFSPADGFFVFEESWANQIQLGPIKLTSVPVQNAGPGILQRYGSQYAGTLGLVALKQFDLIIDGPGAEAYMRPKKVSTKPYQHNRLGAVFVPRNGHTNEGIATVVEGSPAYDAGIRDGDRLLQVDRVRVEGWTEDWLSKFVKPAGTKLKLTLERSHTNFTTTAVLRDIVSAKANGRN